MLALLALFLKKYFFGAKNSAFSRAHRGLCALTANAFAALVFFAERATQGKRDGQSIPDPPFFRRQKEKKTAAEPHCGERRFFLQITANRSRLVRRDLREKFLISEKAKTTLFAFSHCAVSVGEKGEFARFIKGVPQNIAQRGKKRRRAAVRRTSVVPSNHGNFFHQLERNFVKKEGNHV